MFPSSEQTFEHASSKESPKPRERQLSAFCVPDLKSKVRLLDPPLHEFIPHTEAEMASVAKAAGVPLDRVRRRAAELQEANPMLGHRGCRLAITYPEICERLGVLSRFTNGS